MNRVLTLASCWKTSSTCSTPSSTKETAPTCMPIVLGVAAGAAPESSAPAAVLWRKLRRFIKIFPIIWALPSSSEAAGRGEGVAASLRALYPAVASELHVHRRASDWGTQSDALR